MRPPPAIIRRAVLDPIWIQLALGLAVLLSGVAAIATLVAPLSRRRRLPRLCLFGALYLTVNASLVLCCAVCWLRYPLPSRDQARWSRLHEVLLRRALSLLITAAGPLLGFRVVVQEPPDSHLITGKPLLLLARHGGPGDSFALVDLLMSRYRRRPAIVMKETLRWDPGLDVLLGRLPSCFIRRGERSKAPERLATLAQTMRSDDAILLFPEGGNWTPGRHSRAIARLMHAGRRQAAVDAAENRNVLPPQPTGMLACMSGRPDLSVAVVAHTGLEDLVGPALIWRAVPVRARPMIVRWWFQPARSLPATEIGRREWLRLQWALVDSWIDARKAARTRPGNVASVPEAPFAGTAADDH
jgi:1-acyl-sn-glycerol-3-phosphate acyltransferase